MADEAHIDLLELCYEARLAVCALILGTGGLLRQQASPELISASNYLAQAGAAIDAAEALLSLKPLPLAPLLAGAPDNIVSFRGRG